MLILTCTPQQHLQAEYSSENLIFWKAVDKMKQRGGYLLGSTHPPTPNTTSTTHGFTYNIPTSPMRGTNNQTPSEVLVYMNKHLIYVIKEVKHKYTSTPVAHIIRGVSSRPWAKYLQHLCRNWGRVTGTRRTVETLLHICKRAHEHIHTCMHAKPTEPSSSLHKSPV